MIGEWNIVAILIVAIVGYLFGNMQTSLIVSRLKFRVDVRLYGSGNAGLTNFYRTFGTVGLVLVILVDVVKSVIAMLIARGLMHIVGAPIVGVIFSGFCLMLGHIYPVFHNFKGGKGVLCACVMTFMVRWWIGLIVLAVFILVLVFTRYVSLGSICGAIIFAPLVWLSHAGGLEGLLGLFCALLLIFAHRQNIVRLLNHKENKFEFKISPRSKPSQH